MTPINKKEPYHEDTTNPISSEELLKQYEIHKNTETFKKEMKANRKIVSKRNCKLLFRKSAKLLSQIILWVCAVGGFVLSLIQYLHDKQ